MKILVVADLHLRHDRPICRADEDWMKSQETDLGNIQKIIKEKGCEEVWLLGDIFHRPVEPPEVVNLAIDAFSYWHHSHGNGCSIYAIAGNHDLEHHSLKNWQKSSLSNLFGMWMIHPFGDRPQSIDIGAYDFGDEDKEENPHSSDVVLCHKLVFKDDKMKGLITNGWTAEDMVKKFPSAVTILMGDYHEGWDTKIGNTQLAMIGCMNIQSGKLKDYKPRVAIFDDETFELEFVELPQDHVKITTEHLVEQKLRDDKLERCMNAMEKCESMEFDFVENLRELVATNNKVNEIALELIDHLNKETK